MDELIYNNNSWEDVKEKIKESAVGITDSDLILKDENKDELYERLAKKLNKSKQEIKDWIQSIASNKSIAG